MRIIGNKTEIDILLHLTENDSWAYSAVAEMLRHASLEIADNMPLSNRKFLVSLPDGEKMMSLEDVAGLSYDTVVSETPREEISEESPKEVVVEKEELPQEDGTLVAARSRLSSIGCVLEDGIATTEQGQKFEVYIQKGGETVESFVTRIAPSMYDNESSALLVARDCEDKSRLIRIARTVLGPQVEGGKAWFATSPDMSWGKGLVFSNLHLASPIRQSDDIERAAGLHYAARKQILCNEDWLSKLKEAIAAEIEEGVRNLGELSPDEQLDVAKDVVKKVARGDFSRADLGNAITVRKLIDMDILNPFEQHKVALTDKGVLLAKAWGAESVSKRPTPVDNIVLLVRTLLNGNSFERDVMILDGDVPICVRCARGNELREVVENDGMNHLFFALHDSAEPSEFEFLAKSYCDKVAAWRVSELRENSGLPRIAYRES